MTEPLDPGEPGVRWSEGDGARLARGYGDAAAEYRALRDGAAVVDRSDRALLRLHGRDPFRILQGILSNDVALAGPGRVVYATLLTARGRMLADLRVFRRPDDFLLELPAAALAGVAEHFRRTIPPLFARWEDVSDTLHVVGVYGAEADHRLGELLAAPLPDPGLEDSAASVPWDRDSALVVSTRLTGGSGYDVVLPTAAAAALRRALIAAGVPPAGHAALDVLRIEAGVPCWGAELTPERIPLEAGLQTRAISTTKGCYTGQEVITRILHRGHVNWLLRGLLLGEAAGVRRGTELIEPDTGKQLGQVTSSAWSPRLDQEVALAYVRREVVPDALVHLADPAGRPARVVTLPFVP